MYTICQSQQHQEVQVEKNDTMKVTSVMKDNIKGKPTISNTIRLGKKGSDKPHLLKITVTVFTRFVPQGYCYFGLKMKDKTLK